MKTNHFFAKLSLQLLGLFLMTIGIAFSVKAELGISPLACLPYVLSLMTSLSMGLLIFLMQTTFVLLQIAILRKQFRLIDLLQIPVAIVFGYFTDMTLAIVSSLEPSNYVMQWLFCLLGLVIVAFGTFLCVKSTFPMPAGGGLVKALAKVSKLDFGRMKVSFDGILVLCAVAASLLYFNELEGIREGTIASALLVGSFIRYFNEHVRWFDHV